MVLSISFFKLFAMKGLAVLSLFILIYSNLVVDANTPDSLAPYAIKAIIDAHFAKNVEDIQIINFGRKNGVGDKSIEKLFNLKNQSTPMKIFRNNRKYSKNMWLQVATSSIMFFDSPEDFHRVRYQIVFQHRDKAKLNQYIVFVHGAGIETIRAENRFQINRVIYLIETDQDSIDLVTAFQFTPYFCWQNQFRVINRFTRKRMRWDNSSFFVEKFSNFHGCNMLFEKSNREFYPWLYQAFSQVLNFKIVEKNIVSVYDTVLFKFGYAFWLDKTDPNFQVTHIEQRKLFVPPGELYGDYEKMFLPFDTSTLIGICVLALFASSAILTMKLMSRSLQDRVFGSNTRSPLMNVINILLNGGQHGTMLESAPRIVLATFLFWSMIIR
jgi:hypothetical protein